MFFFAKILKCSLSYDIKTEMNQIKTQSYKSRTIFEQISSLMSRKKRKNIMFNKYFIFHSCKNFDNIEANLLKIDPKKDKIRINYILK